MTNINDLSNLSPWFILVRKSRLDGITTIIEDKHVCHDRRRRLVPPLLVLVRVKDMTMTVAFRHYNIQNFNSQIQYFIAKYFLRRLPMHSSLASTTHEYSKLLLPKLSCHSMLLFFFYLYPSCSQIWSFITKRIPYVACFYTHMLRKQPRK